MFHYPHYKILFRFKNIIQVVRIQSLHPFQNCRYQTNPPSPLSQCLQSSFGFSQETALAISHRVLRYRRPKNPHSVFTFFQSHGLSKTHIKAMIQREPLLLCYASPESTLGPKIQFLKDKGISESVVAALMVYNPWLLRRNIERHIKPVFNFLVSILGTDDLAALFISRFRSMIDLKELSTNLTILKNRGVQNHHLSKLLVNQSSGVKVKPARLIEIVEMVEGMGLKPQTYAFVRAVFTIVGLSPRTWDAKFKVYMSLGWSAEEVLSIFRKHPACMLLSEEKIRKGFDYLTKELGWGPLLISVYPNLLSLSLEKRIIPRHRFLQILASKGFIKNHKTSVRTMWVSEKKFLKKFVERYESEVPDIFKIYDGMMREMPMNIKDREA